MIPRFEHIWHKGLGYAVDRNQITVQLDREMTLGYGKNRRGDATPRIWSRLWQSSESNSLRTASPNSRRLDAARSGNSGNNGCERGVAAAVQLRHPAFAPQQALQFAWELRNAFNALAPAAPTIDAMIHDTGVAPID